MKSKKYLFILLSLSVFSCAKAQETEVETFVAYNKVRIPFKLILPEDYEAKESYELAFLFTETHKNDQEWHNSVELLQKGGGLKNTILAVPQIPLSNDHWKTHPIHHALNDLMKHLRKEYGANGQKFHFIGYKSGQDVAQTYANMSREYVKSNSIVLGTYWKDNKQEWFNKVLSHGIPVFVYDKSDKEAIPLNLSKTSFEKVHGLWDALQKIDLKIGKI